MPGKLCAGNPSYDADSSSTTLISAGVRVPGVQVDDSATSATSTSGETASDDAQVLPLQSHFHFMESVPPRTV